MTQLANPEHGIFLPDQKGSAPIFPPIDTDLLEKSSLNKRSKLIDGWGVSIFPFEESVMDQQLNTIGAYARRLEHVLPGATKNQYERLYSDNLINWAGAYMSTRFKDRCQLNVNSFVHKKVNIDRPPEELAEVFGRAISCKASPAEMIFLGEYLGMGSIELGRVTAPVLRNQEVIDDMDEAVLEAVDIHSGQYEDNQEPEVSVVERRLVDGTHDVCVITSKQRLAVLPSGTVIARRSTYVVEVPDDLKEDQIVDQFINDSSVPKIEISIICYAYNKERTPKTTEQYMAEAAIGR